MIARQNADRGTTHEACAGRFPCTWVLGRVPWVRRTPSQDWPEQESLGGVSPQNGAMPCSHVRGSQKEREAKRREEELTIALRAEDARITKEHEISEKSTKDAATSASSSVN